MTDSPERRLFLKYLGLGLSGALLQTGPLGPLAEARGPMPFKQDGDLGEPVGARGSFVSFTPVQPTSRDDLVLPEGFAYELIAAWGDPLPGTNRRFGYNADFTAFLATTPAGDEGVLFVNHEYISLPKTDEVGVYRQTFPRVIGGAPSVEDYMQDVGASVLHVRRDGQSRWTVIASPLTRRLDANTRTTASGPALRTVNDLRGTIANCSGCRTPWNTVLTCEENFQDYVPEPVDRAGRGTVGGLFRRDGAHFGWVVEVDPLDPEWTPVKHTMLGRFRHENVAIRTAPGRRVTAYMGDDRTDGHVYKFVSTARYASGRASNRGGLLSSGRLFVAVFREDGSGEWRELNEATPLQPRRQAPAPRVPNGATTLGHVYTDLGAIVTDAFHASNLIGATPTGRPEDLEIHPLDDSLYIAFTADARLGSNLFPNPYGEIWRIVDDRDDDADGVGSRFTWMRWKAGGPDEDGRGGHAFAAPDNLSFDTAGNLWVVTDIASVRLNKDARYTTFQNNGIFFVPTSGPHAGMAMQFASGPCESELTGPSWTPDERTLFLSVQHPGETHGTRTDAVAAPRGSNWPSGSAGDPPRPGVVSISRRRR